MNTRHKQPVFSIKQILFITLLMAVTISACSLSSLTSAVATVDADTAAATVNAAVIATIAAETTETAVSPTSTPNPDTPATLSPTADSATATPTVDSVTATPAPTATEQGESNGQSEEDTNNPVFSNVEASDALVYYNDDSCGKTAVTIQATVTDDIGVERVWVNYRFMGDMGGGDWRQANLTAVGNNSYEATIDAAQLVGKGASKTWGRNKRHNKKNHVFW